ncbi:sulfotransferase 6B1 [Bombina bombina]|uniref:sulfotransferase 6B1 n=1 Tax=Bombina bombina TaxID=8345 RepID=UPI00235A7418|nr:sulfotransferase 6B1 [Bombina bombina]
MMSWAEFADRYSAARQMSEDDLLFNYNGVLYPSSICYKDTFKMMDTFEVRKDDVLMTSYPKTGTIWILQLLNDMVFTVHNKPQPNYVPILEIGSPQNFEDINKMPSPRVIGTHVQMDSIPKSIFKNGAKILVLLRNPKDTAVSCFHFYKSNPMLPTIDSWDDFFPYFLSGKVFWGSYFDYAAAWNKRADDKNVLIMIYEEMKEDLVAAVRKISTFFGMSLTEDQVDLIAHRGVFKNMKEKSTGTYGEFGQALFRKGDVGDWKNHFSEAQSQAMDAKFQQCLAGTKVGERIKYNVYCKW